MLLADTCRELYPAEERLCFIEKNWFSFPGTQPVLLGWEHPWTVCRIGTGSFLHIKSCSQVWAPARGLGRPDKECAAGGVVAVD